MLHLFPTLTYTYSTKPKRLVANTEPRVCNVNRPLSKLIDIFMDHFLQFVRVLTRTLILWDFGSLETIRQLAIFILPCLFLEPSIIMISHLLISVLGSLSTTWSNHLKVTLSYFIVYECHLFPQYDVIISNLFQSCIILYIYHKPF